MGIDALWEKALAHTRILRHRVQGLLTCASTDLPYIFLAESGENVEDTLVRKGGVVVDRPSLILPAYHPQFEGFDFEKELHVDPEHLTSFLLVRGVRFPSLKYSHTPAALHLHGGRLDEASRHYLEKLQREEDIRTGLLAGPEDCWQLSVLIFVCSQVLRSADGDVRRVLEDLRKRGPGLN